MLIKNKISREMDAESVWAFEKATDHALARASLSGDLIPAATDFSQVLNLLFARAVRVESGSILSHRVMKVHLCATLGLGTLPNRNYE
jgi:hypothetical protein